jgi:uncharacterized protein (DUF488 family)
MSGECLWSIGHSNHGVERFVELLRAAKIDVVADVRSQPFSRRNGQFNQPVLRRTLHASGIGYTFLGEQLGGRPRDPACYDADGHVLYGRLARLPAFAAGIDRLLRGCARYRVAMMCSEENPAICHRHLLIARVLLQRGIDVLHLRADGTRQLASSLIRHQVLLFEDEDVTWRSPGSIRSASPDTAPRTSSVP